MDIIYLCLFAGLAGFIDSVAGGGGLIQLPALLIFFPYAPVAHLLGTNKLASVAGTLVAAGQYARHVRISLSATAPATLAALLFSFLGARIASLINTDIMRVVIILLLAAIAVYTFIRKDFGTVHREMVHGLKRYALSVATGAALGFYDGFFGPGTGSFLIFIFIGIFGFNFLSASASSKIINVATNLSAVIYFACTDNILYMTAIPMAAANIAGSLVGARLAILKGNRFVRALFLIIVTGMIFKLAYGTLMK